MTRARGWAWLTAVATVLVVLSASPHVALLLSPALVLLVLLSGGLFPGERALERLRARYEQPRNRPLARPTAPPAPMFVRRTGRLIAFALAVRPPPRIAAALT
jgi:hypothetical protein